jgi:catechol 2,3-dioxygenase-like lactoylglutathione lyase family enzyme
MAKSKKKAAKATRAKARGKSARKTAAAKPARKAGAARGALSMSSAAPSFTVSDIDRSIAWYRDVLGFVVAERWERDGTLLGAEMSAGPVSFMLGQDDWKKGRDRQKGEGVRIYCTTGQNVDQLADGIKARGGTLAHEPRDEWGMRQFSIDDPDGYKITIAANAKG